MRTDMTDKLKSIRGLAVFDLDGTLLRGDTVCEVLAKPLDRLVEMKEFEGLTEEHDIAAAREQMIGWYKTRTTSELLAELPSASWAPGAHEAVRRLQSVGVAVAIASLTWQFAVSWFASQLSVADYLGTDLFPDGRIIHVWPRDKARWMRELAAAHGVRPDRIAAIGDSKGDLEMLHAASLRVFVGSTVPSGLGEVIHAPNANLCQVADRIIDEWASGDDQLPLPSF